MLRLSLFLVGLLVAFSSRAQSGDTLLPVLQHTKSYPFTVNGEVLTLPDAGGLSSISASNIDYNGDGLQDLFLYDRVSGSRLALVRQADNTYRFEPDYLQPFQDIVMNHWVLLRDYDNDGDQDLFTPGTGVGAYIDFLENVGTDMAPAFVFRGELETRYSFQQFPNQISKLNSPSTDIPGLADIDFDGDMDLLVYDIAGIRVTYHRNFAMENYGRADTFDLILASSCWGHFMEEYIASTNEYDLLINQTPCNGEIAKTDQTDKTKHQGGGILPIDLNGDQLMDIVVSDIGVNYMVAGFNGGTQSIATIISKDTLFPNNTQRVNLQTFPAGFYVDVSGSDARDLIVAPNERNFVANRNGVWRYENRGTDENPLFEFAQTGFLQDQMLDGGSYSAPLFTDYDNDGDHDLLLAIGELVDPQLLGPNTSRGYIQVYENTGSDDAPEFKFVAQDHFKFLTGSLPESYTGLKPTAADMDGDGDEDLLIGTEERKFLYFENTTTGGLSYDFKTDNYRNLNGMANWFTPAPELYDLDVDGDQDLLVGTAGGYVRYLENTGSATQPSFQLVRDTLGGVLLSEPPSWDFEGYVVPRVLDYDFDGQPELMAGNVLGKVFVFDSLETALSKPMPRMFNMPLQLLSRRYAAPAYLPTHADSGWVLAGEEGGGVFSYRHQLQLFDKDSIPTDTTDPGDTTSRVEELAKLKVLLYPNPTDANFSIETDRATHLRVFDLTGRELLTADLLPNSRREIAIDHLPAGCYLVQVTDGRTVVTRRLLKVE